MLMRLISSIFVLLVLACTTVTTNGNKGLKNRNPANEDRLAKMCFSKVKYELGHTKESFSKQYGFEPLLFDLFKIDYENEKVNFPLINIKTPSEATSLAHAFLVLEDWDLLGCFHDQKDFKSTFTEIENQLNLKLNQLYPALSSNDAKALIYFQPWWLKENEEKFLPSDKKRLNEVLQERTTAEVAEIQTSIWQSYKIAILMTKNDANSKPWSRNTISFLKEEFSRFNNNDNQRLKKVLPTLRIIDVGKAEAGKNYGYPHYHGLVMGFSEQSSRPAIAWMLWHEAGHIFDKTTPENSNYISNLYCSAVDSKSDSQTADRYTRSGVLKSFGRYQDFFTTEYSPDDYRRNKNFELVSYQCRDDENGKVSWTESLRQSDYNRGAAEQIADDFAHFIMYPGRFFFENNMVAPGTYDFFNKKLGTDYLNNFTQVFRGTALYEDEKRESQKYRKILEKYKTKDPEELSLDVTAFFLSRLHFMKDPLDLR